MSIDQKTLKMECPASSGIKHTKRSEELDYLDDLEAEDRILSPGCYLMMLRKYHSRANRRRAKSLLSLRA